MNTHRVINILDFLKPYNTVVDAPKIKLDNYELCKHLTPFFMPGARAIEAMDYLIGRLEVRSECLRLYPSNLENPTANCFTFIQSDLPKGLFDHLQDVSAGPCTPFPKSKSNLTTTPSRDAIVYSVPGTISAIRNSGGANGGGTSSDSTRWFKFEW